MLFGEYLVRSGIVSEEALKKAMEIQHQLRPKFGQLALERGWVDKKGIFQILSMQRKTLNDGLLFGVIAQRLGLLIQEQVNELLLAQDEPISKIGEILMREGNLNRSQLVKSLMGFQQAKSK